MVASLRRLNPFGIYPALASRIVGLGGTQVADDPRYAFFSPYTPASAGRARLTVRFSDLRGSTGRLNLIVRVLPRGSMVHAREVVRKQLNFDSAPSDLSVDLDFATFPGAAYALAGEVSLDAVAEASSLEILWQGESDKGDTDFLAAPATSSPNEKLLSRAPPSLADPISQMCTASQFEEPVFASWVARMGEPMTRHRKQWEFVFILQTLSRYGALQRGGRGLGFGVGREPLSAVFASMGIDVVATDLPAGHDDLRFWNDTNQHGANVEDLRNPAVCSDAVFERHVRFRPVDMASIPEDLADFDFTWSSCAFEHLGSIDVGLDFVMRSIDCLRPGGIAVHTTELNLTSDDVTIDNAVTVLFRRRDMEQLALRLIEQGHKVAPLCFHVGSEPIDQYLDLPPYCSDVHLKIAFGSFATTSFGIIVQRGDDT